MSSEVTVREIRFVAAFPWLRLGRAFGCALALQQVTLACLAVFVWTLVSPLIHPTVMPAVGFGINWDRPSQSRIDPLAVPLGDVVGPAVACFSGQADWWRHGVAAAAAFVLWSIVGLAISRCAAIQFSRDENPEFQSAVRFSLARIANVCGAPLIPLAGVAVLCVLVALLALPAWIPALGTAWLWVLAPILFVLSAAAAFALVVVPAIWPLMVAAVAADDGDAFDAFSRAFSLVASRFWSTLGLAFVCVVEAVAAAVILSSIASTGVAVAAWSADWTVSKNATSILGQHASWWAVVFVRGVMASLFWTLATIVYLFLREMVDGVPVSRLKGFDEPVLSREPYPVVGIAATGTTVPPEPRE
uniref:Uncharacterized protein n=1 Tax=Schlesneria paludicola TaxID=360056 RepID=A0A7C2JZ82_9PLAN